MRFIQKIIKRSKYKVSSNFKLKKLINKKTLILVPLLALALAIPIFNHIQNQTKATAPLPTVSNISPNSGSTEVNTQVELTGTDFMYNQDITQNIEFTEIVAGNSYSLALDPDGNIWAWGRNNYGQLGNGNTTDVTNGPLKITTSGIYTKIAGGSHSLALDTDGNIWAWGQNNYGQLGNGNTTNVTTGPVKVTTSGAYTSIAIGDTYSLALDSDGNIWAWGRNNSGQLGNGNTTNVTTGPVKVTTSGAYASIAAGNSHSLALGKDSNIWAWGFNYYGQLGNGNTTNVTTGPVKVTTSGAYASIVAGSNHSLALGKDGNIWAWGQNSYGQVGNGGVTDVATGPAKVTTTSGYSAIATGFDYSLSLDNNGNIWAWGNNYYGQLGNGNTTAQASPEKVTVAGNFSNIATGYNHSLALDEDGNIWGWGQNTYGQVGNGRTANVTTGPVKITTSGTYVSIAAGANHSLALDEDGNIWAWGYNYYGQVGDGRTTDVTTGPVKITTSGAYASIATGENHSMALGKDGNIWAWGRNNYGQIGIGSYMDITIGPVDITDSGEYTSIIAGSNHSLALDEDGNIWAWGYNYYGQVGDGRTTDMPFLSKVTITGAYVSIAAGDTHSLALDIDGNVWSWGRNNYGQLGNGNITNVTTGPAKVTTTGVYTNIATRNNHSLALGNDDNIWGWGQNTYGQVIWDCTNGNTLGNCTIPIEISATEVTGTEEVSNVQSITIGGVEVTDFTINSSTSITLTTPGNTSGTKDMMLTNLDGQTVTLPNAFTYNLPTPTITNINPNTGSTAGGTEVEITGMNFFYEQGIEIVQTVAGNNSFAIDKQGNLYAWGWDQYGQVGDGTDTANHDGYNVLVPKKINGLDPGSGYTNDITASTEIVQVVAGYSHTIAIDKQGNLYAWGRDNYGQVGDGTDTANHDGAVVLAPKKINGLNPGDGYTNPITAETEIIQIAAGNGHSLALDKQNNVYAWGYSLHGQIGDGTDTANHSGLNVLAPKKINGLNPGDGYTNPISAGTEIIQIVARYNHNLAIDKLGKLYAWGQDNSGQIGDGTDTTNHNGTTLRVLAPKIINGLDPGNGYTNPITAGTEIAQISVGYEHSLALDKQGNLYIWGQDTYGQIGDGTDTANHSGVNVLAPKEINGLDPGSGYTNPITISTEIAQIEGGGGNSFITDKQGNLYAWGRDNYGQVGDGTDTANHDGDNVLAPKILNGLEPGSGFTNAITTSTEIAQVSGGGGSYTIGSDKQGNLYAWGLTFSGQIGDGNDTVNHSTCNSQDCVVAPKQINNLDTGTTYVNALNGNMSVSAISTLTLGGVSVTNLEVVSNTLIKALTPPHSAGPVDVTLTTIDGQVVTVTNGYTYEEPYINLIIDESELNIDVSPNIANDVVSSTKHTVSFTSNIPNVDLSLNTNETHSDLTHLSIPTANLPITTGTLLSPITLNSNTWGFGLEARTLEQNNTTSTTTWASIPNKNESPILIKSTTLTEPADPITPTDTDVYYGTKINLDQLAGYYRTTVVYTAVEAL